MAYQILTAPPAEIGKINDTECIGDSLNKINNNFLKLDEDCQSLRTLTTTTSSTLGVAVTGLRADINILRTDVNSLSSQVYSSGAILQKVVSVQTPATITTGASIVDSGLTALTLTRKRTNSKILFEIVGGRSVTAAGTGHLSWLYTRENSGSYAHYNGVAAAPSNTAEFMYGEQQGPHSFQVYYTPGSSVLTLDFKVYIQRFSTTNTSWHTNDASAAPPFILSVTEIA